MSLFFSIIACLLLGVAVFVLAVIVFVPDPPVTFRKTRYWDGP